MSSELSPEERARRKKKVQRAKKARRRRRNRILLALLVVVVVIVIIAVIVYQNSYSGTISKGNRALQEGRYDDAVTYYETALEKNEERPQAYTGMSRVYLARSDLNAAEAVFTDALEEQPDNADLYEACIQFYLDTEQQAKIPKLLDGITGSTAEALSSYVITPPEFSLDAEKTYDEVQEVSLTCGEGLTMYYTDDGSDPTVLYGLPYEGPIQLGEGTTVIRAIAVDDRGIPSMDAEETYVVELPLEDAPAVSPSTGQYDTPVEIEVKVPDGYTAYYTMNGVDPSTASDIYEGPIEMPEGETLFKVIVVSPTGRISAITTRNYLLGDAASSDSTDDTENDGAGE